MPLPILTAVFQDWQIPLVFLRATNILSNFEYTKTFISQDFQGILQPLSPQQLELKPEGERNWQWFMIHTQTQFEFGDDDRILYQNIRYKIMEKHQYILNGFFEYHIVKDYE